MTDAMLMKLQCTMHVCNYQKRILSSAESSFGSDVDTDDVKAALDNLLRLEIYYKQFNYEGIEESPAYTVQCDSSTLHKRRKVTVSLQL